MVRFDRVGNLSIVASSTQIRKMIQLKHLYHTRQKNDHATVVKLPLDTGKVDASSRVRGHREVLLLDPKGKPLVLRTLQREWDRTPLSYSVENGNTALAKLLIEASSCGNIFFF